MEINELNNTSTDNTKVNSLDVTNYQTSDELDVGENNYDYGESLYAKNRRGKKIAKIVSTTLIVGASGLLGGTLVVSMLSQPKVVVPKFHYEATDVLQMDYSIENTTTSRIFFLIYQGEKEVYRYESTSTNDYSFTVINLKFEIEYNAKLAKYEKKTYTDLEGCSFTFMLHQKEA